MKNTGIPSRERNRLSVACWCSVCHHPMDTRLTVDDLNNLNLSVQPCSYCIEQSRVYSLTGFNLDSRLLLSQHQSGQPTKIVQVVLIGAQRVNDRTICTVRQEDQILDCSVDDLVRII